MVLTNKQEQGLRIAIERYNAKEPYTCIAGFAGTGKTTLIRFIVSALNIHPENVAYCAYTGKAAMVLKEKGNENAMTCHRLLYHSKQRKDGTFFHVPKSSLPAGTKLVVVDEVSMVPKQIWELLLSHHIHVIACGDPFQLPPIGENNVILDHPHIFLDEVMRQAQESEIIRLSMDIRAGRRPRPFRGTEINIVNKKEECTGMYAWADQIICGKNNTRFLVNRQYRHQILGYEDDIPREGDKIVCLKNNWDIISAYGDPLINGMIGTIQDFYLDSDPYLETACYIHFTPDNVDPKLGFLDYISTDLKLLTSNEESITKENFIMIPRTYHPEKFNYGYAITCHKSQGSEYNKVLLIEEILKGDMHARWLYTGVTRAKEKLTLVLNY